MELLMEYMAKGFMTMLMISMPCVLTAAGIGLVVGILQAVTQVQEQTIAAAPKILAVFLVITIGGYGFVRLLTNLTTEGFAMAFNVIPKNDEFVLPSDYYNYTRPFDGEMKDVFNEPSNLKEKMRRTSRGISNSSRQNPDYITPPQTPESRANLLERIRTGR
ncbi:MAG: hypothetical protein DKM22_06455 [Candidatus Melainabacteria bacterium]|nr:MAG: hypothetical protein DKM22_06455 [Candidatus Melainabacteria bacterium]